MLNHFAKGLLKAINEKIAEEEKALGNGQCPDFNEYKKRTGVIAGLRQAKDLTVELLKKSTEEVDE